MLTIRYDYRNFREKLKLIKETLTRHRDKKQGSARWLLIINHPASTTFEVSSHIYTLE